MRRFRRLAPLSLALVGLVIACSAAGTKDPGSLNGNGDGGLNIDGGGIDPGDLEAGTGILGDPQTCEEAARVKAYVGCDFWPTVVANNVWSIFDYAVIVANGGDTEADVQITGPGGLTRSIKVAPGSLAKAYLPWVPALKGADADNCGGSKPLSASVKVAKGAYHLVASRPVTVYQFNALEYQGKGGPTGKSWASCPGNTVCPAYFAAIGCFSFSNDASLLLPSTAMTGNYRVAGSTGMGTAPNGIGPYVAVTGTQDGTSVTVKLGSRGGVMAGGGIAATSANGSVTFTLNAGDVAQLVSEGTSTADLSGALISASKPVQVISGIPCRQNPLGVQACDHLEESVFPAETLGKDYFVTVPTGPKGNVVGHVVRIVGNRDGTNLTYAPTKPIGAPLTINAGQVVDLGQVKVDFRVTGDQEFAVASLMLGAELLDPGAGDTGKGDPSMSFSTAIEQYRKRYIFLAPDDYDVSYADIIHPEGTTITLDGASLALVARPIGTTGFSITRAKLGVGKAGAHELTASKPVGLQVMGYGSYTSYQYPGGLDLKSIAPPPVK